MTVNSDELARIEMMRRARLPAVQKRAKALLQEWDPDSLGDAPISLCYRVLHHSFKMYLYQYRLHDRLDLIVSVSPHVAAEQALSWIDEPPPDEDEEWERRMLGTSPLGVIRMEPLEVHEEEDRRLWLQGVRARMQSARIDSFAARHILNALTPVFHLARNEFENWIEDSRTLLASDSLTGNILRAILTLRRDRITGVLTEGEALLLELYGLR